MSWKENSSNWHRRGMGDLVPTCGYHRLVIKQIFAVRDIWYRVL